MGLYDWGCQATMSIDNSSSDKFAYVTVNCYWVNDGWNYDIGAKGWVGYSESNITSGMSSGVPWSLIFDGGLDTTSDSDGSHYMGGKTYQVLKKHSPTYLYGYACARDNSGTGYAGGWDVYSTSYMGYNPRVTMSALKSYTVSYNANGGVSAPPNGTKWLDEPFTITNSTPTKPNSTSNGYVITLNSNGGTNVNNIQVIDTLSFAFSKWNTAANGGGTSYTSGSTYSSNNNLYLYAIYTSTRTRGSITSLPNITRTGFTFKGWNTKSDGSGITITASSASPYTPTSDITLYAIWQANLLPGYTLKSSKTQTWKDLVDSQTLTGSTLYESGGRYGMWGYDSSGYITLSGNRIKKVINTLEEYVKNNSKPELNAIYKYYI